MEKCKNIIRRIDFFGTFISFRLNKNLKYKSLIGGTFTLTYILASFIYIIYMAVPFIKREDINFTYSNKIASKNPFINLTSINFIFAFGPLFLSDAASAINDSLKYFTYKLNLIEWVGIDELISKEIKFDFCNESNFPSSLYEQFEVNEINELYCPIIEQNLNYSLDGLYTDDYYKFITIDLILSEYGQNNIDEVRKFLNENPLLMSFFFIDTAIDYENKNLPLPLYINYVTKNIDFDFIKKSEIFLSSVEFINDIDYFIEKKNLIKKIMFDHCDDSFRVIYDRENENKYEIFQIELKVSQKITNLNRKYQKFPEFIASLSGVLSFLSIVIIVSSNLIQKMAINQQLLYKMLKFKGNKNINVNYLVTKFKNINFNENSNLSLKKFNYYPKNNSVKSENKKIIELFGKINLESVPFDENIEKKNNFQYKKYDILVNSTDSPQENIKINNNKKVKRKEKLLKRTNNIIQKIEHIRPIKKNDDDNLVFTKPNIIKSIFNYLFFCCSSKIKRKKFLLLEAENKINYYLDIQTYIKTVQEIELLKEILFDKASLILFQFLSKASLKILNEHIVFNQKFIKEFEQEKKIDENEIDKLYLIYQKMLSEKEDLTKEKLKLIDFLKNEINFFNE